MVEYVTREIKLQTIVMAVKDCNDRLLPARYGVLISECGKFWGTRRQSAQELLKALVADGAIVIDGREVWTYDRWEKIKESRKLDYKKMQNIISGDFQKSL